MVYNHLHNGGGVGVELHISSISSLSLLRIKGNFDLTHI